MEKTYLPGNPELLTMFRDKTFDRVRAGQLIQTIVDIDRPILGRHGYSTTYLYEAQDCSNLEAVRFLLDCGADPNFCNPDLICDCAFWDLQYPTEEDAYKRLEIAKLFLDHGADPNLVLEGEPLISFVGYSVYNEAGMSGWAYFREFYKLLVLYGGGGGRGAYKRPEFSEPIDKTRAHEYRLRLYLCEDGYHVEGRMFNPEGKEIGIL